MAQNQASNRPTSIIDSKSLSNFDRKPPMNADAVGRPLGHYKSLHHRVIIPRTSAAQERKGGEAGARTMLVYPRAKIFFGQNMKIHVYLGPVAIRMCWFFCCFTIEKNFQSWGV